MKDKERPRAQVLKKYSRYIVSYEITWFNLKEITPQLIRIIL